MSGSSSHPFVAALDAQARLHFGPTAGAGELAAAGTASRSQPGVVPLQNGGSGHAAAQQTSVTTVNLMLPFYDVVQHTALHQQLQHHQMQQAASGHHSAGSGNAGGPDQDTLNTMAAVHHAAQFASLHHHPLDTPASGAVPGGGGAAMQAAIDHQAAAHQHAALYGSLLHGGAGDVVSGNKDGGCSVVAVEAAAAALAQGAVPVGVDSIDGHGCHSPARQSPSGADSDVEANSQHLSPTGMRSMQPALGSMSPVSSSSSRNVKNQSRKILNRVRAMWLNDMVDGRQSTIASFILDKHGNQMPYDRQYWSYAYKSNRLTDRDQQTRLNLDKGVQTLRRYVQQVEHAGEVVRAFMTDPERSSHIPSDLTDEYLKQWLSGPNAMLLRKLITNDPEVVRDVQLPTCLNADNLARALNHGGLLIKIPPHSQKSYEYFNLLSPGRGDTRHTELSIPDGGTDIDVKKSRTQLAFPASYFSESLTLPKVCVFQIDSKLELLLFYRGNNQKRPKRGSPGGGFIDINPAPHSVSMSAPPNSVQNGVFMGHHHISGAVPSVSTPDDDEASFLAAAAGASGGPPGHPSDSLQQKYSRSASGAALHHQQGTAGHQMAHAGGGGHPGIHQASQQGQYGTDDPFAAAVAAAASGTSSSGGASSTVIAGMYLDPSEGQQPGVPFSAHGPPRGMERSDGCGGESDDGQVGLTGLEVDQRQQSTRAGAGLSGQDARQSCSGDTQQQEDATGREDGGYGGGGEEDDTADDAGGDGDPATEQHQRHVTSNEDLMVIAEQPSLAHGEAREGSDGVGVGGESAGSSASSAEQMITAAVARCLSESAPSSLVANQSCTLKPPRRIATARALRIAELHHDLLSGPDAEEVLLVETSEGGVLVLETKRLFCGGGSRGDTCSRTVDGDVRNGGVAEGVDGNSQPGRTSSSHGNSGHCEGHHQISQQPPSGGIGGIVVGLAEVSSGGMPSWMKTEEATDQQEQTYGSSQEESDFVGGPRTNRQRLPAPAAKNSTEQQSGARSAAAGGRTRSVDFAAFCHPPPASLPARFVGSKDSSGGGAVRGSMGGGQYGGEAQMTTRQIMSSSAAGDAGSSTQQQQFRPREALVDLKIDESEPNDLPVGYTCATGSRTVGMGRQLKTASVAGGEWEAQCGQRSKGTKGSAEVEGHCGGGRTSQEEHGEGRVRRRREGEGNFTHGAPEAGETQGGGGGVFRDHQRAKMPANDFGGGDEAEGKCSSTRAGLHHVLSDVSTASTSSGSGVLMTEAAASDAQFLNWLAAGGGDSGGCRGSGYSSERRGGVPFEVLGLGFNEMFDGGQQRGGGGRSAVTKRSFMEMLQPQANSVTGHGEEVRTTAGVAEMGGCDTTPPRKYTRLAAVGEGGAKQAGGRRR